MQRSLLDMRDILYLLKQHLLWKRLYNPIKSHSYFLVELKRMAITVTLMKFSLGFDFSAVWCSHDLLSGVQAWYFPFLAVTVVVCKLCHFAVQLMCMNIWSKDLLNHSAFLGALFHVPVSVKTQIDTHGRDSEGSSATLCVFLWFWNDESAVSWIKTQHSSAVQLWAAVFSHSLFCWMIN